MAEQDLTPAEWTVAKILAATTNFLVTKASSTPRLDAELLLSHVLNMPKVQLYVNFDRSMAKEELDAYRELIRRRAAHEPVAYILERKEFYGLNFKCSKAALIPRPETEHMVDEAIRLAKNIWPAGAQLSIADIGCGTGAIGLALAHSLPGSSITAVDISEAALALAQENAKKLDLADRASFYHGNLLEAVPGQKFHLICANLPYIPSSEMPALMPDVSLHEPHLALDGGPQGISPLLALLRMAPPQLENNGRVLLEIWPESLSILEEEAARLGFVPAGEVIRDLAGHARIAVFKTS